MSQQLLARRVDILEERMHHLEQLPARLDTLGSQLLQFRDELRADIRAGDEETRRQMRMLHEEVIARLALIQEGGATGRGANSGRPARRTNR